MTSQAMTGRSDLEPEITELLEKWSSGEDEAIDALMPRVYEQLHAIAAKAFRSERKDHTMQATALVNEAYVRLVGADVDWQGRGHFFALAARMMRRILVNHAIARNTAKRSGGDRVSVDDIILESPGPDAEVLELHEALEFLESSDSRKAEILELHYFGGLTFAEIADITGMSESTLRRDLRFAKAWLKVRLEAQTNEPG